MQVVFRGWIVAVAALTCAAFATAWRTPYTGLDLQLYDFEARTFAQPLPAEHLASSAALNATICALLVSMCGIAASGRWSQRWPALVIGIAFVFACVQLSVFAFGRIFVPPVLPLCSIVAIAGTRAAALGLTYRRHLFDQLRLLSSELASPSASSTAFALKPAPRSRARADVIADALDRLRTERRFIAGILGELPIGVATFDRRGVCISANAAAANLLGVGTPADVIGGRLADIHRKLPRPSHAAEASAYESRMRSGRIVRIMHNSATDQGGSILTLDDVTDQRIASVERDEVLDFLTHDLRAPITSILATLDTDPDAPLTHDARARIRRFAQRSLSMSNDFLLYVKASHSLPSRFTCVDLRELVQETCDEVEESWTRQAIRIDAHLSAAQVEGDCSMLQRALRNLLDNAARASPAGAAIEVTLERIAGLARIVIRNHGAGIPKILLPHLFKRFVSESASEGSIGLGLALVKKVCDMHGAAICVENIEGDGARFTIDLPSTDRAAQ